MNAHEFPESDGNRWCLHCGCLWHPQMTATCLQRTLPKSGLAPAPKRREFAHEDADAISVRLAELDKERIRVWNEAAE